ncbi:hypothetical protein [Lampropedia aestuarii]|uniref:hypothetical protein n=1 Tax=Lampropedia aestuarii TaxID=2562762 RepID=UPI002468A31B|nr:hypothetical protein [Lampropedia aestuarii]MDH5857815.1 hypothetical protein [Lampropedia aestuarii]
MTLDDEKQRHTNSFAWCLSRCAAVMTQQPLHESCDDAKLAELAGDAKEWKQRVPNCVIWRFKGTGANSRKRLAEALMNGGSALIKLERTKSAKVESDIFWVWVVGIEMQKVPETKTSSKAMAALVVSPEWLPSWASGYGARVSWGLNGLCIVRSVEGHLLNCRYAEMVLMEPKYLQCAR